METYKELLEKTKPIESEDGKVKIFNQFDEYYVSISEILPDNFKDVVNKKYSYEVWIYNKKTEAVTDHVEYKHGKYKMFVDKNGKLQKKGFF